ncbi:flagellar hook-associated protein FlgK [Vibrio ostreicida]|uniref:Flagellar hook-associated protein 1 n=1 Tax=Vibrio ostreicida TaxID=526588 RepID=A0ABT8BSD8_9VIBR|nr:flagellar hook-associated protein FlgK [Vibrio ostreicida]MDN3609364.1 flagellar hook-associated protein FlgK [Vibrio ostreicida]NPD08256.1 flagellar hook-associated protein FlgK [Vibrio ostreicida]
MASDLLNLGSQSVLTAQRQLNTTGHNISNVNTEGYNRQSVIQGTNMPRQYGGETYGMGVHVDNVRRSWDEFAVKELNSSSTNYANKLENEENLEMLSNLLSSVSSKKIPENINEWFDAVKSLADSPNDIGARKVVLEKADLVTQNLNDFHETVRLQSDVVNKKLDLGIERMNQLAFEIRDMNRLMMRTPGPHNDLLDEFEKLVTELSDYTKVTVTNRNKAEGFNIHIGNGHTLVSGTEASQLKMIDGYPDVHQRRLAMVEGKGIKAITTKDIDGKLGSMLTMRDEQIPDLLDQLGKMATAFSHDINQLQSQGLDLRGHIGGLMFTDVNSDVVAKSRVVTGSNSTADLSVYIEDTSKLVGGEYSLQRADGDYYITRPDGVRTMAPVVGGAITLDGLRIDIKQDLAAGERVLLRPTRRGAQQMKMETNDPTAIAAQSYEASTTFAQGGAGFSIVNAGQLREFEVIISPDGKQFAVTDTKGNILLQPQNYPPTGPVTVQGTTFGLTEGALPNDKFTANLVPSEGDNGNLLKMQNIQTDKRLNEGESTVLDIYHNLNTDVGLQKSTASRLTDVSKLEKEAAQERVASVSGVNLDEEAANMMKFQQAYMASSRIMQASNDTFNAILALR